MTAQTAPAHVSVLDPRMLVQFARYGLSGGAAVTTHLAVLMMLIELAGSPPILGSVLGFASATFVNYMLQHLAVTLGTMTLNTLLFSILSNGLEIHYLASQVITIGVIVPINFMLNRSFTFRVRAAGV